MLPILFAIAFPSLVTWLYFVALADQTPALQQGAYSVGKVIQFGFPAVWTYAVLRRPLEKFCCTPRGLAWGIGFGLLVAAAMLGLYHLLLQPAGVLADASVAVREKVTSTGLASRARYLGVGCFYVVFHSLMEEYYWRWFVFRELHRRQGFAASVVVSSLGFMAHHVILLGVYFGWASPLTYLFSLAVAIGGAFWAWLYQQSQSLLAPWVSHAFVDAAIFAVGYHIVQDLLVS